jgi:arsenate reductase
MGSSKDREKRIILPAASVQIALSENVPKCAAFASTLRQIRNRVHLFLSLPLETLDRMAIESRMRAIGQEPL